MTIDDPDADLEEWRQTGEIVSRAAERMSVMIDGLLAAARLEANGITLVDVDLADVVGGSVEEFSASLTSGRRGSGSAGRRDRPSSRGMPPRSREQSGI